jgi:ribosomal protein L37AE/L43A
VPNVRGEKRHPFSCPDTMWDWLAERGRALGVSRSEVVRRLIRAEQERISRSATCTACGVRPVSPEYADVQLCEECATEAAWFTEQAD